MDQERGAAVSHPWPTTSIANSSLCMDERQKQIKQTKSYSNRTISQSAWNKVCPLSEKATLSAVFSACRLRFSCFSISAFLHLDRSVFLSLFRAAGFRLAPDGKPGFSSCAFNIPAVTDVKQVPTSARRPPKGSHRCCCVPPSSLFRWGSIFHARLPFPPPGPPPAAALTSIHFEKIHPLTFGKRKYIFLLSCQNQVLGYWLEAHQHWKQVRWGLGELVELDVLLSESTFHLRCEAGERKKSSSFTKENRSETKVPQRGRRGEAACVLMKLNGRKSRRSLVREHQEGRQNFEVMQISNTSACKANRPEHGRRRVRYQSGEH